MPASVSTQAPSDPLYEVNKLRARVSELEHAEANRLAIMEENKMLRSQLDGFKASQSTHGTTPSVNIEQSDEYQRLRAKYNKKKAAAKKFKKQLKERVQVDVEAYENLENDNKKLRERIDELEALQAQQPQSSESAAKVERLSGRIEELESVRAQSNKLAQENDILKRQIEQLKSGPSSSLQS